MEGEFSVQIIDNFTGLAVFLLKTQYHGKNADFMMSSKHDINPLLPHVVR